MLEDFVNAAMTRLQSAAVKAVTVACQGAVDVIQDELSVPVEYLGKNVIRSRPGERPREETGRLREGIAANIEPGTDEVTFAVESAAPYSARLEKTRPFMAPALERMTQTFPNRVAEAMANELSD